MLQNLDVVGIVMVICCLLVAMVIHEFMHGYVGYLLGDDTAKEEGRLSFNPLDHIDPVLTLLLPVVTLLVFQAPILAAKPVPFDPRNVRWGNYGAALLAAAGPFSNLALAFLGALLAGVIGSSTVLSIFVQLNVALFVFNLVPIPPLDGSRIVYAFAPRPVQEFLEWLEPYGFFIVITLVVMGGFGGWIAALNQFVLNLLP